MRYYKYSYWLAHRFNRQVFKACIDASLGCPHRQGVAPHDGCIFCDGQSFSPTQQVKPLAVAMQVNRQIERLSPRYPDASYLAYFQAGTNTHAPVDVLRELFTSALLHPKIVGLVIGTRPDCVDAAVLDLLEEIAQQTYVAIEYGMQTSHDRSLAWMNRGHDAATLRVALGATCKRRGVEAGVHVILGIPGETLDDVAATAHVLNEAGVTHVKIHNLYVTHGTRLHEMWLNGEFQPLSREDYMVQLSFFLQRLSPAIAIGRLVGEVSASYLAAPMWNRDKPRFLEAFHAYMSQENSWQGKCCSTDLSKYNLGRS